MSDDELGDALRTSLREIVDDVTPSQALQDRVHAIGQHRTRNKIGRFRLERFQRPRAFAATCATAAAAAIAIITLGQSTVAPSYAVTIEPNHWVQVTLYQLSGTPGANARLRALGVRAVIVPIKDTCAIKLDLTYIGVSENPAPTIHLIPGKLPAGGTLILAAKQIGPNHVEMAIGRVTGRPPSCVKPGSGPGLTGPHYPAASGKGSQSS